MAKQDVPRLNSSFPEFQALTSEGEPTGLQEVIEENGAVLVLYRGWW